MLRFGIIDGIIEEPVGGAHAQPEAMADTLKAKLVETLRELQQLSVDELIHQRIEKYDNIGVYREGDTVMYHSAAPQLPVRDPAPADSDEPEDKPAAANKKQPKKRATKANGSATPAVAKTKKPALAATTSPKSDSPAKS